MNTSLKTCFKCGSEKSMEDFYKHPQMKDGHLNKCKDCTKRDVANRYNSTTGRRKIIAYEKKRFSDPVRKRKALEYQRRRRLLHPEKTAARNAVSNAIRAGKLTREPCEICGDSKSEAHHHDYTKPIDVRWLCFKHHREVEHRQKTGL